MRLISILLLASLGTTAFGAKVKRALNITIRCESVLVGARDAIYAEKRIGTTDDPDMQRRAVFSAHQLTSGQATALTNLCDTIDTAMGL